jgi:TPR repeat protein
LKRLFLIVVVFTLITTPFITFAETFSSGIKSSIIPNYKEAARIFKISAEKGDRNSQHYLGVILYKGIGVKQSYEEAFRWLTLAANQGHSQAKLDLAVLKYHKKGIPKNHEYKGE